MTTLVGTQQEFSAALIELCELDFDAIEAYDAAIKRLENASYKEKLTEFRNDHVSHVQKITALLTKHNLQAPDKASAKKILTKGKVVLASLIGDIAILTAMKTNEDDTNKAYERLNAHPKKWPEAVQFLEKGWDDERRHRTWIENTIK